MWTNATLWDPHQYETAALGHFSVSSWAETKPRCSELVLSNIDEQVVIFQPL
jgi:hypothetical protein